MILMRLVWMQLRSYPVMIDMRSLAGLVSGESQPYGCEIPESLRGLWIEEFAFKPNALVAKQGNWFSSPGFVRLGRAACNRGVVNTEFFIRNNQWLLIASVFGMVLATRFMTGSWLMSLLVGVILMSRGRLITGIGHLSIEQLLMPICVFWLVSMVHFVKTASWSIFFIHLFFSGFLIMNEPAFVVVPFITAIFWGLGNTNRKAGESAGLTDGPGNFLRPLDISFKDWLSQRAHRFKVVGLLLATVAACFILGLISFNKMLGVLSDGSLYNADINPDWYREWMQQWLSPIDTDLIVSFAVIGLTAFLPIRWSLVGLGSITRLFVAVITAVTVMSLGLDLLDYTYIYSLDSEINKNFIEIWGRAPSVILWVEPIVLSFGAVGMFNFFLTLTTKLQKKPSL